MKTFILRRIGDGWFEDVAMVFQLDPPIAMDLGNKRLEPATVRAELPNASVIWAKDRESFLRCIPHEGGALVMLDADQYEPAPKRGRCEVAPPSPPPVPEVVPDTEPAPAPKPTSRLGRLLKRGKK